MGAYTSQAHFWASLSNVFGELKFNKEVYKAKKTGRCIHKVHARCRHSGTSRVNANDRKRQRETLSVLELLLCMK